MIYLETHCVWFIIVIAYGPHAPICVRKNKVTDMVLQSVKNRKAQILFKN